MIKKIAVITPVSHLVGIKELLDTKGEIFYLEDNPIKSKVRVLLETKEVTYSYFSDPMYVFMDEEYNQFEVESENMTDALKYLVDGMECSVVFYNERPISVDLPTVVVRNVIYTEPAARGDTSGKVMKPAKIDSGFEVMVPDFVKEGDKIEIDTRTDEYRGRAK